MVNKTKQDRVKNLLVEAMLLLCEKELDSYYSRSFIIQGLLGITLDSEDIFLVDINEAVTGKKSELNEISSEKDQLVERAMSKQSEKNPNNPKLLHLLNSSISEDEIENVTNMSADDNETDDLTSIKCQNELKQDIDTKKLIVVTRSKSSRIGGIHNEKKSSKSQVKPQVCYQCGITTKNMYGLKNHLATVHNEGAKYKCDICNKGFLQRQSYEEHLNAHKGKKTHCCPVCGKSTPFATSMRRHMKHHRLNPDAVETPRPFQCNQCPSKFKTEISLKEHVNIEHLDRRIRCGCGQEFKWRSAFGRHKTKCVMSTFSVTDPNPQHKERKSQTERKNIGTSSANVPKSRDPDKFNISVEEQGKSDTKNQQSVIGNIDIEMDETGSKECLLFSQTDLPRLSQGVSVHIPQHLSASTSSQAESNNEVPTGSSVRCPVLTPAIAHVKSRSLSQFATEFVPQALTSEFVVVNDNVLRHSEHQNH